MAVTRYISYKCYNFIVLRYNTASLCLALNVAFSSTQNTLVKVFVPLRPLFHLYTIRFITNITASLVNKSYSCSLFRVKFINVSILCAIQRRGRRGSPVTDVLARQRGALPFTSLNTAVAVNPEIIPCCLHLLPYVGRSCNNLRVVFVFTLASPKFFSAVV